MAVRIRRQSRLQFYPLVTLEGFEFWDFRDLPIPPKRADDLLYQVTGVDRIDTLAVKFYGAAQLWWVIAVANDWEILPTQLNVGDKIIIPSPNYIRNEFFRSGNTRRFV